MYFVNLGVKGLVMKLANVTSSGVLYAAEDKALFSMMSGWVDEEKKNLTACTTLSLLGIQTESEDLFTPGEFSPMS